jgi:crotonobetainyl-CoA:carnitine CoA-transferase CaiB-like acyl-CoA transferase
MEKAEGMLSPYRVLDLTTERGFICGKLLGDLGANVIKIEKPGGDPARSIGPFYHDIPDPEKSLYWWAFNTSKRGITLDIETADGQEIFKRLVRSTDVLIESFDPGYMDKIGLSYSVLSHINPQLIMTSITGFGQTGPYKDYKAPDIVVWALSGNAQITGDPDRAPLTPSYPVVYNISGPLHAAVGTMVALYHRQMTGEGQQVDVSTQLSLVPFVGVEPHGVWEQDKTIARRQGSFWLHPQIDASGRTVWISSRLFYQCKDGHIAFAVTGGGMGHSTAALARWIESERMASEVLKKIDWMAFDWQTISQEVVNEVSENFERFFLTQTKSELMEEAGKRGIMLYPLFTPKDMLEFNQLMARKYWVEVEHPELGRTITYPGSFIKTTEAPYRICCRAPLIGEHNEEIYIKELGLSKQELLTLKQMNVI